MNAGMHAWRFVRFQSEKSRKALLGKFYSLDVHMRDDVCHCEICQ